MTQMGRKPEWYKMIYIYLFPCLWLMPGVICLVLFLLACTQDQLASYDVNGNDHDPMPRYDSSNENK